MRRKEKVTPLVEDKFPSFVALGRQVAASGPQLTPEQEAARRRIGTNSTRKSGEGLSGGIGCIPDLFSTCYALRAFASAWTWIGPTN
jgi:hypothetical protein